MGAPPPPPNLEVALCCGMSMLTCAVTMTHTNQGCTFYVSYVAGSDSAAGTSVATAFKTIQKGIDAPARSSVGGAGKTVCLISDGVHYINTTINFGTYNSGAAGSPVHVVGNPADIAAGRGRPVISGAVEITRTFSSDPGYIAIHTYTQRDREREGVRATDTQRERGRGRETHTFVSPLDDTDGWAVGTPPSLLPCALH